MSEYREIIAYVILIAAWVFLVLPLIMATGHSNYLDDLKGSLVINLFIAACVVVASVIMWAAYVALGII
jgi:hypothetical protein